MKLLPRHEQVIGRMIDLVESIAYLETIPTLTLEAWEAKEYKALYNTKKEELADKKALLLENESFWNEELMAYKMSVVVFIAKYNM